MVGVGLCCWVCGSVRKISSSSKCPGAGCVRVGVNECVDVCVGVFKTFCWVDPHLIV